MIGISALALAFLAQPASAPTECSHDRQRLLALPLPRFDQDHAGGWRPLADRAGCRLVAADLIRDYRQLNRSDDRILIWHEGQLRAMEGLTQAAVTLFEGARQRGEDRTGWNHYVDATIAFLRADRPALEAARERLMRQPRPEDIPERDASGRPVRWPMNLHVIDRYLVCFGRTYVEAMTSSCGEPGR